MARNLGLKEVKKHEPSQFTIEFSDFYRQIISKLYNVESREFVKEVKNTLKSIRQLNHDIGNWQKKQFFEHISYKEPAARCAYMYAYSIINTSVVYCEFLKHLKENESLFFEMFSERELRICCLGGGPGLEVVGIWKAIHDMVWKSSKEDEHSLSHVNVTIVDTCLEWKSEAFLILNPQNRNTELFRLSDIRFETEYLEADLLKPIDGSLQEAVKDSNIVTIVKLANDLQKSSQTDHTSKMELMVKSVSDCMKEGSCLFMLDTAGGNTFNNITKALPVSKKNVIKQTHKHKAYRLHPTVLQKLESAINFSRLADTSTLLPTSLTRISSCIWIKSPAPVKEKMKKKKALQSKKKDKKNPLE